MQLAFHLATYLCGLVTTCILSFVKLKFTCMSTQGFPRLTIQSKLAQVSWLQVICICVKFMTLGDLCGLVTRLAIPFGHPLQVPTQVLVLQTLSGQGLTVECILVRPRLLSECHVAQWTQLTACPVVLYRSECSGLQITWGQLPWGCWYF